MDPILDETNLPHCFGKEWEPTDAEMCQDCAVQEHCSLVFSTRYLDQLAEQLGQAVQAIPEHILAEKTGTSLESIRQARAIRFAPSSRQAAPLPVLPPESVPPAAAPGQAEPAPKPTPAKRAKSPLSAVPAVLPSVSQETQPAAVPEPAPSQPKRGRGRPKKAEPPVQVVDTTATLSVPTVQPLVDCLGGTTPVEEASGVGFVLNLTMGAIEQADWPKFPPLFPSCPKSATPVLQVTFWCQPLEKWVWLVSEPSGRPVPEGAVELTWQQLVSAGWAQRQGTDPRTALRAAIAPAPTVSAAG